MKDSLWIGEHQQLIRDVEQLKVRIGADAVLAQEKIGALDRLMNTRFDSADRAVQAALLAAKEAVEKANGASEKRFDAVNEFRGQLSDMVNTLIPRKEAESRFSAIEERVSRNQTAIDKGFTGVDSRGAAGREYWGYLVGGLGVLAVIISTIIALTHLG